MPSIGIGIGTQFGLGSPAWSPAASVGGSLPLVWLRADTLATLGDDVTSWTDKSGNGNTPAQETANNRPTLASSVAGINNQPAVNFDPTSNAQWLKAAMNTAGTGDAYTIFIVCNATTTSGDYFLDLSDSGLVNVVELGVNATSGLAYNRLDNTASSIITPDTDLSGNGWGYLTYVTATASRSLYLNGTQEGSENTFSVTCADTENIHVGVWDNDTTWPLNGSIAEIIVYNATLSAASIAIVEAYIQTRYGL